MVVGQRIPGAFGSIDSGPCGRIQTDKPGCKHRRLRREHCRPDPLINAWGIAIRPAGFGGHFWVESNGAGTTNEFIGDVGGTPLFSDDFVW